MNDKPVITEQDEDGDWVLADGQDDRIDEIVERIAQTTQDKHPDKPEQNNERQS